MLGQLILILILILIAINAWWINCQLHPISQERGRRHTGSPTDFGKSVGEPDYTQPTKERGRQAGSPTDVGKSLPKARVLGNLTNAIPRLTL